jgi:hypothetical protein
MILTAQSMSLDTTQKGPVNSNLCTVSAALAYDDALTGESVILVVHQAIYIPDLSHNLLSTMQLLLNDVAANNVPRFLTDKPTQLTHTLVIPTVDFDDQYAIPMSLHGEASSFLMRKPTVEEYESLSHLVHTGEEPAYDPHDTSMAKHEDALAAVLQTGDHIGALLPRRLCSVSNTLLDSPGSDGVQLALKRISTVHNNAVFCDTMRANISTIRSASAGPQLTPQV